MSNKELYGSFFSLKPIKSDIDLIVKKYGSPTPFINHLLSNDYLSSYSYLKKMKHIFDSNELSTEEYEKNGGLVIKNFINKLLSDKRGVINRGKTVKSSIGMENQFLKTHNKSFEKPKLTKISSSKQKIELTEWVLKEENEVSACICIILNDKKEILLLKRSDIEVWMPNKYALVGGKLEKGEDKYECVIREVVEETGLILDTLTYLFNKIEGKYNVDIFIGYVKDSDDILLSDEHTEYKWVKGSDISEMETVPDLLKDIEKGLKIFVDKTKKESI